MAEPFLSLPLTCGSLIQGTSLGDTMTTFEHDAVNALLLRGRSVLDQLAESRVVVREQVSRSNQLVTESRHAIVRANERIQAGPEHRRSN